MIEILENVSYQVKRVENMHSGSVPALEGEYFTPPLSQRRVNTSSKLSVPPNLPIFSGQEPVPVQKGQLTNDSSRWRGALVTHTEEEQLGQL